VGLLGDADPVRGWPRRKVDATTDQKQGVLRVDEIHRDVPFAKTMTEEVPRELTDLAAWLEVDLLLPACRSGGPLGSHDEARMGLRETKLGLSRCATGSRRSMRLRPGRAPIRRFGRRHRVRRRPDHHPRLAQERAGRQPLASWKGSSTMPHSVATRSRNRPAAAAKARSATPATAAASSGSLSSAAITAWKS